MDISSFDGIAKTLKPMQGGIQGPNISYLSETIKMGHQYSGVTWYGESRAYVAPLMYIEGGIVYEPVENVAARGLLDLAVNGRTAANPVQFPHNRDSDLQYTGYHPEGGTGEAVLTEELTQGANSKVAYALVTGFGPGLGFGLTLRTVLAGIFSINGHLSMYGPGQGSVMNMYDPYEEYCEFFDPVNY